MNYTVDKKTFQDTSIQYGPVNGNKSWGNCLHINVPATNGSIVNATLMKECEKKYIKQDIIDLCNEYKPKRVLEVGFGLGYTATQFQECGVEKHVIVEAHPQMVEAAKKWKENYPNKNIEIVFSFLQDYIYDEKDYDLIYDDRYEIIDRDLSYKSTLKDNGFIFKKPLLNFPCWKVIK